MIAKYGKRTLSLFLALIMLLSVMPVQAFADEFDDVEAGDIVVSSGEPSEPSVEDPEEIPEESGESEALIALRAEIAAYVEELGITPDMPDQMLLYAYGNHESYEAAQASLTKQDEFVQKGMLLSEAEQEILLAEQNTKLCQRYREVVAKAYETELLAEATVNGVKFATTSAESSLKNSNGKITATVKAASSGCTTITYTASTMVLYITNTSDVPGAVSFDMTQSKINSIYAGDASGKSTGENLAGLKSYTKGLGAGESFTIIVTTGKNSDENKLEISNVSFVSATTGFTVEVEYNNAFGSVTSPAESTNVDADGTTTMTIPNINAADGVTLTANSASFLCWVDKDNKILSKAKNYTVNPSEDTFVKAVFTGGNAYFLVNGEILYGDLNAAISAATSASSKTIVLVNDGTLPAGNYTIPSGITLLIPYDDANTLRTTAPTTANTSFSAPKVYRKLTMAEGANITINGALSLSATQSASGGISAPIGNCSFIQMNAGSTITVNNGGNLYAWGYIQGSGSVTVKNGGTAYECFQIMDWRGGENTGGMVGNSYRVFPMSQYYIQNIEVPMTLEAGATEKGYMSVNISLVGIQGSSVPFIGSDGMFNITDGYVVKDYNETTGRLEIELAGDVSVKSLSISMNLGMAGTKTINSQEYVLPINGNMDITMSSGCVTMTQDIALQPGAKLIIGPGATCTLGSGNKIYVYDYDEWITREGTDTTTGEGPSFCGTGDAAYVNLSYPASVKNNVTSRAQDAYVEVNGVADLSAGYVYTTANGAYIGGSGTIIMKPGTETVTYQIKDLKDSNNEEKKDKWFEIPITSAKLTNADGSVVETANNKGVVTYKSVNGVWTCAHTYAEGTFTEKVDTAATCEAKGSKTLTCNCGKDSKTEEIAALGHAYEAVVTAPTCTEAGHTTYTCKNDATHTYTADEVAALGHDYKAVVTAPTCTEEGYTTHSCANCGDVYTDKKVAALGHTAGAAATCTTAQTCTVCGAELEAAQGHDYEAAVTAPTCTEGGYTTYTCSVCGDTYVADEVAAQGHDYKAAVTAPTCTEGGYTTYTCSVCGDTYVADEVVANGHDHKTVVTAPTCTEGGYTTYTCANCGDSYVADKVAAKGHAWEWVTDKGATVLESGIKHEECTVCHVKQNENTEIPVLACPHTGTMTGTEAKAETCTEAGNSAYWYCSACQNYYSDAAGQHEIEKNSWILSSLGHDKVAHEAKAPTCTEIGWDAYVTCSRCDYSTYVEKAALNHNEIAHEAKAPTCTEIGWDAYVTCSRCDYSTYVEKTSLGHAEVSHEAKAPTCTEIGWDAYVTCSRCDYTTYVEKTSLGHDEVSHEAKAPTCTEIGWDAYVTCSRCDYTTYVEKTALGHDEVEHEAKAPTCKTIGWDAYVTCNRCDYTTRGEDLPVDPDAHVWDEGEEYGNHSCNSALRMLYTCTVEGCEETKLVVIKEQHFRVPIAQEIPATCTQDGMTSGWKCEKCDEFWIPQEVIPALGHDWNGSYPCESESSECANGCGMHFDSKQEHKAVVDPAVEATCTTTGLTEGSHCEYCGEVLFAQTEIPMTDHNWIETDMEIPATCTANGHKEGAKYCLDCDYDADPIPMLEHEWMHRDAKKATYSAIGWNAHDYCLLCKATKTLEQYAEDPCEFCGENPEGYIEIPKVAVKAITDLDELYTNIGYLELMAQQYALEHPGTDPLALVLNYMRTGVSNYTSGSWAIMAGPEDKDFLKYVQDYEDAINSNPDIDVWVNVSGLKKLNGYFNEGETNIYTNNKVAIMSGHFFGTMDMTYHNKGSQNHADVGGWVGDLTDLLSTTDEYGVPSNLTLEEKVAYIRENYLFNNYVAGSAGSFGSNDLYADLDGFYFMNELITNGYQTGDLERMCREYFNPSLTLKDRVSYLLSNRLDGLSTRKDLRTAVYNAYTSNKLISTLEGTRNFNVSGNELAELRKAVCYAFADEICRIAGDYVEDLTNPRFTVFDSETKILAPGISQQINYATNADGKQIVYYVATADVNRDDVGLWVNYYDRDPGTPDAPVWKNNSVPSSAQNAQDRYGDPESVDYIENFTVIASTNAGGYSMQDDATPGGLMVMNGVEWFPNSGSAGFFAILDDGTAYMGTHGEYEVMKDRIQEAIGGFGEFVVKDGQVVGSTTYSDAPRTSVGITATGRVVIMCIDGRQAPFSSGASLQDVGYIMKEAGCVVAINLDGGGSTTFVARQPGSDDLSVMNRPSDGYPRNVSSNLLLYSTAPSSTKFDHAVIESEYDYATINTPVQMTAAGVSPAGNAVDIPEGATWVVGNEDWASITEDGVFTGKRLGEVYVYLMLDGVEIGSKLMTITNPDQVYFEKAKVDAIYGSGVELPLRARVGGKPIAINPNDVTITLSAPTAGTMDGFTFKAVESSVKTLTITAAIGEVSKASINVMLYKQGENSFDFDKATGGDRVLAWDRQVSNAKVEDGNIYNVIDPSKDMVTSYTFALDMTAIPIPERLEELTYMLPGGTMEGTNAWTFLTSLAQRISDLSYVQATVDFDDRFVVDYSEMKILNDYFNLDSATLDEATNTLTLTLRWIKQSQVIDAATANPLFIINGINLTPKAGVWDDVTKIDAVTSGTIGYEIYMRASGLYSFAQKPESQAVFGVYPYRNPADTSDAGGYFNSTYAVVTDEYTLVNTVKEGWINEEGGFAYYVDGERLIGVQEVEGFYYDFGENGVNVGQTKLSDIFFDEEAEVYRYSYQGVLTTGWHMLGGEWHYFRPSTKAAVSGTVKIGGVSYEFEENGKLVSGVWVNTLGGRRYYYGPSYHEKWWIEIDGEQYYFRDGYMLTGIQEVREMENASLRKWYDFGEDGACRGVVEDGLLTKDGDLYYIVNGYRQMGLHKVDGDYYFFTYDGPAVRSQEHYAWETHCDLPCSTYAYGADGKMANGLVQMSDGIYYYFNGKIKTDAAGITKIGDGYYFVSSIGRVAVNRKYYCWATNCEIPCGEYEFGADGKMLQGVVQKDDGVYFYVNGKPDGKNAGITKIGDDYYFVASNGKCAVSRTYYCWATNCEIPCGEYEFGADGKMLRGIVEKSDGHYYYINGKPATNAPGLTKIGEDYYFVASNGRVATGTYYCWATNCEIPCGEYEFGADGKMLQGIVEKADGTYYYTNGKKGGKAAGLTKVGDDYYFVASNGRCATGVYYAWATNCDLPCGEYEFGADGKMLHGLIQKEDGLYSYVYGKLGGNPGLVKLEDGYYFVASNGKVATGKYDCWKTLCDLPIGTYEFGPDGKMYDGFVTKSDGIYYYVNGKLGRVGLNYVDGYYYFVTTSGKLVTNQDFYIWETNGLLLETTYTFNALGQIVDYAK